MTSQLFAVERYDDAHGARPAAVPALLPPEVRLACAVHLPADDAVIALVEAGDESTLRTALITAGWRFDRIVAGAWVTRPDAVAADGARR